MGDGFDVDEPGVAHRRLREQFARDVETGQMRCYRCGERIEPGEPWDLGHDDVCPELHAGPEHRKCNRAAANKLTWSRDW